MLTEQEILLVHESYKNGLTNPSSIVALLYSKGNDIPFTKLKKEVSVILNLKEIFRGVGGDIL